MILREDQDSDHPYKRIPLGTARYRDLSGEARGLLFYLITLPAGSGVGVAGLMEQSPDGPEAVLRALAELEQHGYFKRIPVRRLDGTTDMGALVFTWRVDDDDDDARDEE